MYHAHSLYEILLFLEGDVEYIVENHKYALKPYDMLLIRPGDHHYLKFLKESKYDRMVFRFPGYIIPSILDETFKQFPNLINVKDTCLIRIFERFDQHAEKFTSEKLYLLCVNTLSELLIYINEEKIENTQIEILDETVESILEYINDHIHEPISVQDICEHFYVSKTKLYHLFFEAMKVPIGQYIRNKKIMIAYSLIQKGLKPTQVAEDIGFLDYSTFYRTYVKVVGASPSDQE